MKRVLHVVNHMGIGGIQAFIMNLYRNIDKNEIQFDFLLHQEISESYIDEIQKLGGKVYYVPARNRGIRKNIDALNSFFKEHNEYSIIHMHESSLSYVMPLIVAKKYGVGKRIIHSHSTKSGGSKINKVLHYVNKYRIKNIATDYLACGELAAKWFYGSTNVASQCVIIKNGIDLDKFEFNPTVRMEKRCELGIQSDSFVVGHIGRFNDVKNHSFLIDVFCQLLKSKPNSFLCLAGDGSLKKAIEEKVERLGLSDNVLFLGNCRDVHRLLQAFDVVVMPSFYEGFPVTAVEAEANGVPIVLSDTITKEVQYKQNVLYCSLSDPIDIWVQTILSNQSRIIDNTTLRDNKLDIKNTVSELKNVYMSER